MPQRMQQSMYVAMLADSNIIADQRRLEEQAIADRIAASAAAGLTPPPMPTKAHEQVSSGNYEDVRLAQLEEAGLCTEASSPDDGFIEAGGSCQNHPLPAVGGLVAGV